MRCLANFLQKAPWLVGAARSVWRLGQTKFTAGAVGVVFNEQGQVLLVEHVFHPYAPWGLPGGWVDSHENPAQTVERELQEELSLTVKTLAVLLVDREFGNHLDFAYLCEAKGSVGQLSSELLGHGWYDTNALPKLHKFHYLAISSALEKMRAGVTNSV